MSLHLGYGARGVQVVLHLARQLPERLKVELVAHVPRDVEHADQHAPLAFRPAMKPGHLGNQQYVARLETALVELVAVDHLFAFEQEREVVPRALFELHLLAVLGFEVAETAPVVGHVMAARDVLVEI